MLAARKIIYCLTDKPPSRHEGQQLSRWLEQSKEKKRGCVCVGFQGGPQENQRAQ